MADNKGQIMEISSADTDAASCSLDFESTQSIWHIHYIMDIICGHLAYNDLKSLRLVNKNCLDTISNIFVKKSVINAAESLPEFNESYALSNLKDVTAIKFRSTTMVSVFEAVFEKWCITQVYFNGTKFLNDNGEETEKYEVPANLMMHVESLRVARTTAIVIRTSAIPVVKELEVEFCGIVLDGPIYLNELTMSQSAFIKNGNILVPSEWSLQAELDFSGLKRLQIKIFENFTLSVENLLELECLQVQSIMGGGSRVIGWQDNSKIERIYLYGLDVNLLELPPSVKICQFEVCCFNACTPTNLKAVEIRSEDRCMNHGTAYFYENHNSKLMEHVNLSGCTSLRTLCIDWYELKTSFLPPSLQYLRIMNDCVISGEQFPVDTLSVYCDEDRGEWYNETIEFILDHFRYQSLHMDFEKAHSYGTVYIESTEFEDLVKELNIKRVTMYLNGIAYEHRDDYKKSGFSKLVNGLAHRYKFKNGKGRAIGSAKFFENVKQWYEFPSDNECGCSYITMDELFNVS